MRSEAPEPKWSRLLSLSVHELRTPMTVVAGYIRMLLKERAGPLNDQQRRLLEEAEKSCVRLSGLLTEMSDLANLEAGTAPSNRTTIDLRPLLAESIAALPEIPDRDIVLTLSTGEGPAPIRGDAVRLRSALLSVLSGLRRELVTSLELAVRERPGELDGRPASWIVIGSPERVSELESASRESLTTFDEWRGGCGLGLAVARRIIDEHGGVIWSPPGEGTRAGAVIVLPHS